MCFHEIESDERISEACAEWLHSDINTCLNKTNGLIYKLISEATHEKWINLCLLQHQHQHQHLADIIMNSYIFYTFLEILNGIGSEYIFHWICWKALNYRERTSSYVPIIIKWDAHRIKLKHMVWLLNVSIYDSFNEKNTIF